MAKATMCANSQSDRALPQWKCVFQCCDQCPVINITDQETDDNHPNPSPSIILHVYHMISNCTKYGRLLLTNKKLFRECLKDTASGQSTKI